MTDSSSSSEDEAVLDLNKLRPLDEFPPEEEWKNYSKNELLRRVFTATKPSKYIGHSKPVPKDDSRDPCYVVLTPFRAAATPIAGAAAAAPVDKAPQPRRRYKRAPRDSDSEEEYQPSAYLKRTVASGVTPSGLRWKRTRTNAEFGVPPPEDSFWQPVDNAARKPAARPALEDSVEEAPAPTVDLTEDNARELTQLEKDRLYGFDC